MACAFLPPRDRHLLIPNSTKIPRVIVLCRVRYWVRGYRFSGFRVWGGGGGGGVRFQMLACLGYCGLEVQV